MSQTKGFNKTGDLKTNEEEKLAQLSLWHETAKKNRLIFDRNWYIYSNFRKGNHYIQYDRRTNQIVTPPRPAGQVRLTVNKIYSITRAIRNFATSYRPKWFVVANSTTEEGVNNGMKSAELLDHLYDELEISKLVNGVASYAIDYGAGFFQYGWDDEAMGMDGQPGECDVWIRDPFDVYLDPYGMQTGDIQNCRYIDIAVPRPRQDILNNPNYPGVKDDDIIGDTRQSASDFKNILLAEQYQGADDLTGELETVILHETLYKKRVEIKDENDKGTGMFESQVWIASWIEGKLLRDEQTDFKRYNLIPVPSDNNPNEIYGEGYIKNMIPIIKVLNRLESQVVEYNNMVNRGRIIADKDAGLTRITNTTGEIIEKKPGADVKEWQPAGLASDMGNQINRMNQYLEDISGVKEAFVGGAPAGVTSGVALESLRAQSANNLQDLKDNIEFALAQLGEGILELYATKVVTTRTVRREKRAGSGNPEAFKVIGQVGVDPDGKLPDNTYVIGMNNKVKVTIGSGLAYTHEGRITRLDKMLEQGVIDPQTYLEGMEFGDVDAIISRANQAKFDNAMLENIKKNGMMPPQPNAQLAPPAGAPAPAAPQQDPMIQLADQENEKMLNGERLEPTEGATREHTAVHVAYSQSDEVAQDDDLAAVLYAHIKGEEEMQGLTPAQGGTPNG